METSRRSPQGVYRFRVRSALRRSLARLNVTQNQLARACGVSSGYMSQLLSGTRYAGPRTRKRLLDALPGIEFDVLFEEIPVGVDYE
jgi:transcriptional regulator with XRE-family HTH domain